MFVLFLVGNFYASDENGVFFECPRLLNNRFHEVISPNIYTFVVLNATIEMNGMLCISCEPQPGDISCDPWMNHSDLVSTS